MKKILLGAMIASVALAASAAEVGSQNVVGYAKIDLAEGFNLIGSQFLEVGATVKDVNDFIYDGSALLGLDDEWAYQTTMLVWTGTGYTTYGWLDGEDGTNNEMPEWNNTWLKYDMSDVAVENMDLGKGVWINSANAGTITVLGEVSSADTYTINLNAGLNMIVNPYPSAVSLQEIKTDLDGLNDLWEYQTTLLRWTGTGYVTYGWLDGEDGTNNEMPEWNNSWLLYDMSGLADITLNVGEAVWINAPTAGTVTFTK